MRAGSDLPAAETARANAAPEPGRSRRRSRREHRAASGRGYYALLLLVLAVQAALSLRLVWSNTAFQDEALYLWAGHVQMAGWVYGTPVPDYAVNMSGAPVVYPPLGALADSLGGLAGARLLSLAFMLGSTVLLFSVTRTLFGKRAALGAAAVFAVLGPVQVLGADATYDAMALFLLALAAWCVVRARGAASELWIVMAALIMGLADAAKYASLLWNPVIILLAVFLAGGGGLLSALRGLRLTAYAGAVAAVALFRYGGTSYVHGLISTTFDRHLDGTHSSVTGVLHDSINWVGVVLVLAVAGTVAVFRSGQRRLGWVSLALTVAIVLAPAAQARIHELTSLHKHVAYGAWFAAAVAGYALSRLMELWRVRNWLVAAVAAAMAVAGLQQSARIFQGWPNSSVMTASAQSLVSYANCPCLAAENNVISYYLGDQADGARLVNLYYFRYLNPRTHQALAGLPAYRDAIANHYFGVVELDPDEVPQLYRPLLDAMEAARGYELMRVTPSNVPGEPFIIWRYTGTGGAASGQPAALANEVFFGAAPAPASPLGVLLTPPALLQPFLSQVTQSLVVSGAGVFLLLLWIRLGWRRRKKAGEL